MFWDCVCLNLFFNTMELVEVINIKAGEMKLNNSEGVIELNWSKIIIDDYRMSLTFFEIRLRIKKGLK